VYVLVRVYNWLGDTCSKEKEIKNTNRFLVENLKEREHFGDAGADGKG
jgi:hypothetical protein